MCSQTVPYLDNEQTKSDITIHLESFFLPPDEYKPNIYPPTPEGNIWLSSY